MDVPIEGETLTMYEFIKDFRDGSPLHRIDSGGAGCILIKRKVLEELSKKYENVFEFGDKKVGGQRRTMSEDAEFGERATLAGFEMWLDDRIRPIHLGQQQQIVWQITT
jgi:hypothetical protein